MKVSENAVEYLEDFTEKSHKVEVDICPYNWLHKFLIKKGFMKSKLVFEISPILVGNRYRISAVAVNLPEDTFEKGKLNVSKAWRAINTHNKDLIYVVAVAIQNNRKEPSAELLESIKWVQEDVFYKILDIALSNAGVASFMQSIILIKGANVMNVPEAIVTDATEQG